MSRKGRRQKPLTKSILPFLKLTGDDAGKERYLAFLGQIPNIAKEQEKEGLNPIVLIFTPTSWLIPRPTYEGFREIWDKYFRFHSGFLTTSNEFFKIDGRWPLAFTIWNYEHNEKSKPNIVKVHDLTYLTHSDLHRIDWNQSDESLNELLNKSLKKAKKVKLDNSRGNIRDWVGQKMYDFKRDPTKEEKKSGKLFGGLPLKDERRANKKTYGLTESTFIGFMDDATPVRVKQDSDRRLVNEAKVWFRLDTIFKDSNKAKCFNGPTDNRSYSGHDLESAKRTFSWFIIAKVLNGIYPLWANQYDIWAPNIKPELEKYWYSLCFAFVLAENRCVVTKFEQDNPVIGAPEIFVDNPLCPTHAESFWSRTLDKEIVSKPDSARQLVDKVKELYKAWNTKYCKGQWLQNIGLQNEPYFKYFEYPDFLTPHSGLIQIRKYAENESKADLLELFSEVSGLTKKVKEEIYKLLTVEFKYFD